MKKPSIIITSPSIDTSKNVSGISTVTHLLLVKNKCVNYLHFIVGKEDNQRRNIRWLLSQIILIFNFSKKLYVLKKIHIIHINIPLSALSIYINLILIIISKIFNKIIVVNLHGGALSLKKDISKIQKLIIEMCLKLADKVIVLGKKESAFIYEFYLNSKKDNITILPNSVDVPKFIHKNNIQNGREKTPLRIIFIGRIDNDKGLEEILLAFKSIKNRVSYHFYIAGTGHDQKTFLSKCIIALGDKFSYLGVLNSVEKVSFFHNADIFILPSYFEGLPNALLETMAYGIVPIVTPVGSIPEVVVDGKNGFIVPLNDYDSIAEKITLLHNDRILLKHMGIASYKTILNSYSIDEYIAKLNTIYSSLLIIDP